MNLEEAWKNLETDKKAVSSTELKKSMRTKPHYLMEKITRGLFWKIVFIALSLPIFSIMAFWVNHWLPIALFSVLILAYFIGGIYMIKRYRQLKRYIVMSGNVRQNLESYISHAEKTLKTEEITGLMLYPIAGAAGYFFSLLSRMSFEEALSQAYVWYTLVICLLILTPLGYWLARWMNKVRFDKHLTILKQRLRELDASES